MVKRSTTKRSSTIKKKTKTKTRKHKKKRIFTKKDFVSGDGMMVSLWGPAMWHSLHMISFNYPIEPTKEDKKYYKQFVTNLVNVLPCKYCRQNLKKNLKLFPITDKVMSSRDAFSKYIYQLHERVNKNLGKTSGLSFCDVRERYEHFRSRCTQDDKTEKDDTVSKSKSITELSDLLESKKKTTRNNKRKKENGETKEKGCTESLYGKKAKCVIHIVPKDKKCKTFQIDKTCKKRKIKG